MKYNFSQISQMTEKELLKTRLCDLNLDIYQTKFGPQIHKILQEVKGRGIDLQAYFWLSTEWFCPDGTTGVAIPFYLAHPKLMELEKKIMGEVDGGTEKSFSKVLRHELGHVCDNAFRLRLNKERIAIFGSSEKKYPYQYKFNLYSKNFVRNIGFAYAQSHPDEDFAETFAVWLKPKKQWKRQYHQWPAINKLMFLEKTLSELKGQKPYLTNRKKLESISTLKMTLKEYYDKKKRYYRKDKFNLFDRGLVRLFSENSNRNVILTEKKMDQSLIRWRELISKNLEYPLYKTDYLLKGIFKRAESLDRVLIPRKNISEKKVVKFLITQSQQYLSKGYDKVIL